MLTQGMWQVYWR